MRCTTICAMAAIGMATFILAAPAPGGEVGFAEDFALAKDRAAALRQLVPGTDDYFYYHCLYNQHMGKFDEVERLLGEWSGPGHDSARISEIRSRQALLRYDTQPRESLDYLIGRLNLHYEYERQVPDKEAVLPHRLDPRLISPQTLLEKAVKEYPNSTGGVTGRGLGLLADAHLNGEGHRDLLRRLTLPDYPNLLQLILADLDYEHSEGFGSMEIHKLLTRAQMDELLKLRPSLREEPQFVMIYLTKLRPSEDVNVAQDASARKAHLSDLWAFVSTLTPAFNSLKAHVLYRRLEFDRGQGVYDKAAFMEYLKLPRPGSMQEVNLTDDERQVAAREPQRRLPGPDGDGADRFRFGPGA